MKMKTDHILASSFAAGLAAALLASPAVAQQTTVFDGVDAADEAVKSVEESVKTSFDASKDDDRFSFGREKQGWSGSVSATASFTGGNTDEIDLGLGARLGYNVGLWEHDFVLSYKYSESNGVETADKFVGAYDVTRYLNGDLYAFGNLRYSKDDYASVSKDMFVGAGVGYRVVNQDNLTWRLQAGPGWRVAEYSNGTEIDEAAGHLGSKLWYRVNDSVFLTNDTNVLFSENDTMVANELGMNVSLSGPLALRTSLTTEYHSDPLPGDKNTDHMLGLSLVYSFN